MTAPTWERVKEVLHQAMNLAPDQREHCLDQACGADTELRAEVESLLRAEESAGSRFLLSPHPSAGIPGSGSQGANSFGSVAAGDILAGRFQLIRKLGEGGMGQVWLAEQTFPVWRQVALKLIKAGMFDQSVMQRFQSERQSLAIMDHPAIAKVFDAGTTPQGQPYFVMEYVQGLPITDYCDQKKLKIAQRIELFIQACEGVQHAHQKAIIHRDLKPANVLVAEVDARPVPRIIDFGLAKAITPQKADEANFTQMGYFVGTPGYMSPEQADPNVHDIDTRADVYSLGVILYVLLTGVQPFDTPQKPKQALDEMLRKLREEEPPRPSTKVQSERASSGPSAEARGTDYKQWLNLLRGDLDLITMKALEKDRSRRYDAPSELAADLQRYLHHEPVMARPPCWEYQVRRYVRRHRVGVAVVAGLALLLTAFSVAQTIQLLRITQERDRANRERDRATRASDQATRITDFMTGMFKISDPSQNRGNSVTAREILDKASNDMNVGLAKDPEVQSQMMQVMATTYQNLGLYPRGHELAKSALESRLRLFGPDDRRTLESMTQLAWITDLEGHYDDAEKLEIQTLAAERRVLGNGDALTLQTMGNLAFVSQQQGRYNEGEKLEREAIKVGTRTLGPASPQVLQAMNCLGGGLWYQGRFAEAEQEYRQLLDVERRVLGPDDPEVLTVMNNLALSIQEQHRYPEAEQMYRDNLAAAERVLGPEHPTTINFLQSFAGFLFTEGRDAEAEKLYRKVWAIQAKTLGPDHPDTLATKSELSDDLLSEGHVQEAEKLVRQTLATRLRVLGPENPSTLGSKAGLARVLIKQGRYPEAERLARESFEIALRTLGPLDGNTLFALRQLGNAMAYQHRYAEAGKLFHDVIERGNNSGQQGNRSRVWFYFACVAAVANRPDDALHYLREAIKQGFKNADSLMVDDLNSLQPNPQFQQLVATLKHPPAAPESP